MVPGEIYLFIVNFILQQAAHPAGALILDNDWQQFRERRIGVL